MENVTIEQYEQLRESLCIDKQTTINSLKAQYKERIGHEITKINRALNSPLSDRDNIAEIQEIIQRSIDKIERYINQ